jgi:beta-glucosidase
VIQLYVSYPEQTTKAPIKALKGFQRIALKAGESKTINFTLTPEQLSLVEENGKLYQPKGKVQISVGGGQPGVKNKTTSNIVNSNISIL